MIDPRLPSLVHAHHCRHMEDLPFWLRLAERAGGPVLELGCGTGRLLVRLAQAGFRAYGLDREAAWLAFLRRSLPPGPDLASPSTALNAFVAPQGFVEPQVTVAPQVFVMPQVFVADMSAFHLDLRFGLILLPCNTLSTLSPPARLAMLACARRHLRPGGLFAASLPNPERLRRMPRRGESEVEDAFPHPLSGDPVQVSSAWERTRQAFVLRWHYDHLRPDGRVERLSVETRHSLEPAVQYERELAEAGFQGLETYGDYDGPPAGADAPYWIGVARGS